MTCASEFASAFAAQYTFIVIIIINLVYIVQKVLQNAQEYGKHFIVAWGDQCISSHRNVTSLIRTQEEASCVLIRLVTFL